MVTGLKSGPPEEVDGNRKEATEENDKAIEFNTHADEWPSQQHHQNPTEKCSTSFSFVPLEKGWLGFKRGIALIIIWKYSEKFSRFAIGSKDDKILIWHLEEESEGSFQSNDTGEATDKEDLEGENESGAFSVVYI